MRGTCFGSFHHLVFNAKRFFKFGLRLIYSAIPSSLHLLCMIESVRIISAYNNRVFSLPIIDYMYYYSEHCSYRLCTVVGDKL